MEQIGTRKTVVLSPLSLSWGFVSGGNSFCVFFLGGWVDCAFFFWFQQLEFFRKGGTAGAPLPLTGLKGEGLWVIIEGLLLCFSCICRTLWLGVGGGETWRPSLDVGAGFSLLLPGGM